MCPSDYSSRTGQRECVSLHGQAVFQQEADVRGFRGYCRKILVVVIIWLCKMANRLVGITPRKEYTSQLQPLQGGRAVFSVPSFFWGQLQSVLPVGHVGFRKDNSWSRFVMEGETDAQGGW